MDRTAPVRTYGHRLTPERIDQGGAALWIALLSPCYPGWKACGPLALAAGMPNVLHMTTARHPLSIRDTGDRVLLHCFAGCEPKDVLTAVGLEWKDLYPEPWTCARQRPHEATGKYARRTFKQFDPLEHERYILRIAVADIEADKLLSIEDRARIEVAKERLRAAEAVHG